MIPLDTTGPWGDNICVETGTTDGDGWAYLECLVEPEFSEELNWIEVTITNEYYAIIESENTSSWTSAFIYPVFDIGIDNDLNDVVDGWEMALAQKFCPVLFGLRKIQKPNLMRTVSIVFLISLIWHTQTGLCQDNSAFKGVSEDGSETLNTLAVTFGKLPSDSTSQHFLGRYLITLLASTGAWTLSLATASLIDNGTPNAPRGWFEDNALRIARPSVVLASSTVSMLLYKRIKVKTFLTTTALSSALLLGSHFGGQSLGDEANALLQVTTIFFLVPLTSSLYHHVLSLKEANGFRVGEVRFHLPVPSVQWVNRQLLPLLGVQIRW